MKSLNYIVSAIWDIPVWILTLLLCLLIWRLPRWQNGCLACEMRDTWLTGWWLKRFSGGAAGHSVFYKPGALDTIEVDTPLEYHETEGHVDQFEAAMWMGFITGFVVTVVTGNWILGLVLWGTASPFAYVCGGLVSLGRGKSFYRGNHLEEGARGETVVWKTKNDKDNN